MTMLKLPGLGASAAPQAASLSAADKAALICAGWALQVHLHWACT